MNNITILIVEDNPDHAELTVLALKKAGADEHNYHLVVCDDGEKALDYLSKQDHSTPRLILLDVKLPGIDGLDVLRHIKESKTLRRIPVVILTTSDRPEDINKAYLHHANSFLTKPVGHREFMKKIADLRHYWISVNEPYRSVAPAN